jgi:hypothetical protein
VIRLYGVSIGHGSLARVTAGMRGALRDLGLLAGFVPIDAFQEDGAYGGHDADVAVFVGPPRGVTLMRTVGWHKQRWVLLPPNSSWVPADMIDFLAREVTGLIAPSKWAEGVLVTYCSATKLAVSVWRHGVDAGFTRDDAGHEARRADYANGRFAVAHLASTPRERKGTRELVEGWVQAVQGQKLGPTPTLRIIVEDFEQKFEEVAETAARGDPQALRTILWGRPRYNMDVSTVRAFYQQHHLLAQPSRGEAFGMTILESRACGVPIAATACTGHGDQVRRGSAGVVVVPSGEDAPMDDGPGALAPSVRAEDVAAALAEAYESWPMLEDEAYRYAPTLASEWSWPRVTHDWVKAYRVGAT